MSVSPMSRVIVVSSMVGIGLLIIIGVIWDSRSAPSSYDDCLLTVAKEATTESAVALAAEACRNKFPSTTEYSACDVIWNGTRFVKGRPDDITVYKQVQFPSTPDRLWFPSQMKMTGQFIRDRVTEIQSACPNLTLNDASESYPKDY